MKFRWSYVNSVSNSGQENYWTIDDFGIFGQVTDATPPLAITGIGVSAQSNSSFTLTWNASTELYFESYEVYVSTDSIITLDDQLWSVTQDPMLLQAITNSTTISPMEPGSYWVAMRAKDQSGNFSGLSEPVVVNIDALAPQFTNPLPSGQPSPTLMNSRIVQIGCTATDINNLEISSLHYRIDRDGNGLYSDDEIWYPVPLDCIEAFSPQSLSAIVEVEYLADGNLAFEFRVADQYQNYAYSGFQDQEGISDDWRVGIDSTVPLASNPIPANQGLPNWSGREVVIGCSFSDANQIIAGTIAYRIDANGNGVYDGSEIWQAVNPENIISGNRNTISVAQPVSFAVDGICSFEFRAADEAGNMCYSGNQNLEGISDDWVVRIETTGPSFSNPIPDNQPNSIWLASRTVQIGASLEDLSEIESAMFRYDANGNGIYDETESWQVVNFTRLQKSIRNQQNILISATFAQDGEYHFEFKATDIMGNVGFSGMQALEGISDDWVVKLDTQGPQIDQPIPANQPYPAWIDERIAVIGASLNDISGISSVQCRYDFNCNGIYDEGETWQEISFDADQSSISHTVEYGADGIGCFEFKVVDLVGNTSYSGLNSLEGIADDWLVIIDSLSPTFANPLPINQPYPSWSGGEVTIGDRKSVV